MTRARHKCPNAVIFYFGFYSGVSYDSDTSKLRAFMKHEFNDDFKWWFSDGTLDNEGSAVTLSSARRSTPYLRCRC